MLETVLNWVVILNHVFPLDTCSEEPLGGRAGDGQASHQASKQLLNWSLVKCQILKDFSSGTTQFLKRYVLVGPAH